MVEALKPGLGALEPSNVGDTHGTDRDKSEPTSGRGRQTPGDERSPPHGIKRYPVPREITVLRMVTDVRVLFGLVTQRMCDLFMVPADERLEVVIVADQRPAGAEQVITELPERSRRLLAADLDVGDRAAGVVGERGELVLAVTGGPAQLSEPVAHTLRFSGGIGRPEVLPGVERRRQPCE